ncbi:MAG: ATP-binding protein [Hydrogenophaga sp.]|nr:ATP-binding protein [Burkholderiaceae bacterium]MDZ4122642.1 ATP-binding protein [Hydrogenophaga sp.]
MRQLDLFSALQSSTEGIDTEFKSARGGMPGSFWESYSAMANTQGGTIVLGVAEKSTGLVWEGVPDAAQLRTVLWGQLNDRHKVCANLLRAQALWQGTLARAFSPVPSNQVQT